MTQSHVVSGLIAKRAELAGQLASFQTEIDRISGTLANLDRTIKLFAPEFDLRTIKSKRTNTRSTHFYNGELQRLTLDILRQAGRPLISREIGEELLVIKDLDSSSLDSVQRRLIAVLQRLRSRGIVMVTDESAFPIPWKLVEPNVDLSS